MRRITSVIVNDDFEKIKLIIRDNGEIKQVIGKPKNNKLKYTAEEILVINSYNEVLAQNNLPELTEEEEHYVIDPLNSKSLKNTPEELQRLAGFTVVKEVHSEDEDWWRRCQYNKGDNSELIDYLKEKIKEYPQLELYKRLLSQAESTGD